MKVWTALSAAVFKEHRVVLWIIALQIEVSWLMCVVAGRPLLAGFGETFVVIANAALIFGVMTLAVWLVRKRRRELPIVASYREAFEAMRAEFFTARWLASVAVLLVVVPVSLSVFSAAKQTIPVIHPFAWDSTIEQVSLRIHGGRHMWQWLQPIVGHPRITVGLDEFYHKGWSLLILGTLGLVIVSPRSMLRRRYITAWALLFFGAGTLVALAFSSAGPPYYDQVVKGPDPYASLFAYLGSVAKSTPLLSSGGRDLLWTAYRHRVEAFGLGISAMPSMHVATTTLLACLAYAVAPALGIIATICTVVMAIASVALGWHYALDGYVGAALAVVVWWVAGRLERELPDATTDVQPMLEPAVVWLAPRRRRTAASLPEGAVAVASSRETSGWAARFAQHLKTVRGNREHSPV